MSTDALRTIFTDKVVERLRDASQTESRAYRIHVITLVQPPGRHVPWLAAQRSAWAGYIKAAKRCGLLAHPHGKDLIARLTEVDDDQFRSAMAECQAAWYLSEKLGLDVSPRPRGKGLSQLELLVKLPDGDVHVEVKSPLRDGIADGVVRPLDDSDILDRCLADASKQFRRSTRNLVMLVGRLTLGVHVRRFFVKAFYAAEKWVINPETNEARIEYDRTGRFLRIWPGEQQPRHRRVGGVLFVQENICANESAEGEESYRAENDALMLHNPNALHPISEQPWGDCPQLVARGDVIEWTDGHPTGGPVPS